MDVLIHPGKPVHKLSFRVTFQGKYLELFFIKTNRFFMILKFMQYAQIKYDHGCSLCAWYYTSGGFQLPFRLTPKRHPRAVALGHQPSAQTST